VILGHMTDLSMKRLGRVPPIFAVSAKLACEAKRATPIAADLLAASGFPALEDFISNTICFSPARRLTLETWRDQAATALLAVEDLIATQSSTIQSQTLFIEQIEGEIDEIREQFVTRLPSHLASVAEVFERESAFVTRCLLSRLRSLPSLLRLFTGDQTGLAIEAVFIERLQSAVVDVAEQDGGKVADACHSHWQNLAQRVKSVLGVDLITANPIDETVANARKRFVRDLGHAAREGIGNLQVRNPLDKELRKRNDALKSFVFMTLVLTNIGSICGALNVPWLPGILCGLAALFLAGGVMTAWATQTSIARDFQRRLLDTCGAFASTLHSDYAEALRVVFHDYAASLNNVHTHLDRENHAIEPRRRLRQQLYLTLKAIEQDL
jgi:hypothetical protein